MSAELRGARCPAHPSERAERPCLRCGDFVCLMCGPLEPVALCPKCQARSVVDWEERGEHSPARAFMRTWLESVSKPGAVGARLLGSGHMLAAHGYAAICAGLCLVPMAIVIDGLLFTLPSPHAVGFPSMTVLSSAVAIAIGSVAVPTLVPLWWTSWALAVWGAVLLLGRRASFDVLLRTACYGPSLLALPVIGVLALPVALFQQGAMTVAYLVRQHGLTALSAWLACGGAWLGLSLVPLTMLLLLLL